MYKVILDPDVTVTRLPILVSAENVCQKQHIIPTIKAVPKVCPRKFTWLFANGKNNPMNSLNKFTQNVWEISQSWGMECKKVLNNCDTIIVTHTCLYPYILFLGNLMKTTEAHERLQFHWFCPKGSPSLYHSLQWYLSLQWGNNSLHIPTQ